MASVAAPTDDPLTLKLHHDQAFSSKPLLPFESSFDSLLQRISDQWIQWNQCAKESPSSTAEKTATSGSSSLPKSQGKAPDASTSDDSDRKRKRRGVVDGGKAEENEESNSTKQARYGINPGQDSRLLACPFFKRYPEKFSKSHICVGPGWPTVYRLKEHLFRKHAPPPFQCRRCFRVFPSGGELDLHVRSPEPCEINTSMEEPGKFSKEQETDLRKRTKGPSSQSEREKWIDVYRLLFPDEVNIPSPYYDYDLLDKPRLIDIDTFTGEFLPRVKQRLEARFPGLEKAVLDEILAICMRSLSELHARWNPRALGSSPARKLNPETGPSDGEGTISSSTQHANYNTTKESLWTRSLKDSEKTVSVVLGEYIFESSTHPPSSAGQANSGLHEQLASYSDEEIFKDLGNHLSLEGLQFPYFSEAVSDDTTLYPSLTASSASHNASHSGKDAANSDI